jgi:hypothetical protein
MLNFASVFLCWVWMVYFFYLLVFVFGGRCFGHENVRIWLAAEFNST